MKSIQLFVLILCLQSQIHAQENKTPPRSLLSCVLSEKLVPGRSVNFQVEATQTTDSTEGLRKKVDGIAKNIEMAIIPIPGFDEFAWLEITLHEKEDDSPTLIIKNFIKIKTSDESSDDWLGEQVPLGWMQKDDDKIVRIDSETILEMPFAAVLFSKRKMKMLPDLEVSTKLGKFYCEQLEFQPDGMPQTTVSCFLNTDIGFGCAKATVVSNMNGVEYVVDLTVNEVGNKTKTQLPQKTIQSAVKEFFTPTTPKSKNAK